MIFFFASAGIMIAGGAIEIVFGVNAEGKSLETITKPLTATFESAPAAEDTPTGI